MSVFAFLRTSTDKQDLGNQKLAILDYANQKNIHIDAFIEVQMSTRKREFRTASHAQLAIVQGGDTLLVSELSRLARDLEMLVAVVNTLHARGIRLVSLKEGLDLNPATGQDLQTKIVIWMFSILYEIERTMISERTKMGLARARAEGKQIGRPKGSIGKSKLDNHREDIIRFRKAGVSYAAIGRLLQCKGTTVREYVRRRNIE